MTTHGTFLSRLLEARILKSQTFTLIIYNWFIIYTLVHCTILVVGGPFTIVNWIDAILYVASKYKSHKENMSIPPVVCRCLCVESAVYPVYTKGTQIRTCRMCRYIYWNFGILRLQYLRNIAHTSGSASDYARRISDSIHWHIAGTGQICVRHISCYIVIIN